jgi:rhomboid protease GluP
MFKRQTTGAVVCASCGYLVGVNDATCYHCGRRNPGLWGFAPALRSLGQDLGFVPLVTGLCVIMYAITLLASGGLGMRGGLLGFLSPSDYSVVLFGASGWLPIFVFDRWWTPLSASFLHGSLLHIFFNLMAMRQLAPTIAELYGPGRMVIVYTVSGVAGFLLSSLAGQYLAFIPVPFLVGGRITLGASASIFGLLGALVYYGHRSGSRMVTSAAWNWALPVFLMGFLIPGIDNYAHIGGFVGGYVAGRFLDPLTPERVNHLLAGLICLVLSVLAIVVSFAVGLPVTR